MKKPIAMVLVKANAQSFAADIPLAA